MKEVTMTFEQFFNKNLTIDKKELITLDKLAGEILKNKKLKMMVLTSIAYANMAINVYASSEMDSLRNAKNEIVLVLQICIGIICIVMCLLEIGKGLISGRNSDIGSTIMKYGAAIVATCVIPKVFTWIARMCGVQL